MDYIEMISNVGLPIVTIVALTGGIVYIFKLIWGFMMDLFKDFKEIIKGLTIAMDNINENLCEQREEYSKRFDILDSKHEVVRREIDELKKKLVE